MSFNPDLLFDTQRRGGGREIQGVEGRLGTSDFNQAVTFAEAFGVSEAAVFRFRKPETAKVVAPK
jgi:hypothetical protein